MTVHEYIINKHLLPYNESTGFNLYVHITIQARPVAFACIIAMYILNIY